MDRGEQEKMPSTYADEWWIYAEYEESEQEDTENCGKWMIFRNTGAPIDDAWKIVSKATKEGRLGPESKVNTMMGGDDPRNWDRYGNRTHVICVYTYDYTDEEDVFRVRRELRELGFTEVLPYKSDKATLAGEYTYNTGKRVSMFRQ